MFAVYHTGIIIIIVVNISFSTLISNLSHDSLAVSVTHFIGYSFVYSQVVTGYNEIPIKNTHLILDMIQWIVDFPVIENEKFCVSNPV
jgi:hypothetical protein